ncbi:serine/threonine-protein kinase 16 isoform X2 [Gopherus evgoodei]|uniref:serine/threonine-protein kinase 16 isoform X2 n=1 Tax=Gopherus evgoodei TaxID=1825980 RepID=UPI0011CF782B|nr:serine/threonine-protein kinase 16 isoform X2 [Gopherus evgoodei]
MGHALCACARGSLSIEGQRYLLLQRLGEGGFSYVDLVERLQDGRFYALKRILCHDKEDRREALHERGTLWSEVEALRDKGTFLPEERIVPILLGICRGLEAIHAKGYAHRDLKPTNVLLDDEEQPVLMDLGSMNQACIEVKGSREAMALQDWAAQRCTISYRAPELFTVERDCVIDERTDIWSLGCVLYCMMFGEGPYDLIFQKGDSVALAVQNQLHVPASGRYSAALEHLLSSMMAVNPQDRPHISYILDQLEGLQAAPSGQDTTRI